MKPRRKESHIRTALRSKALLTALLAAAPLFAQGTAQAGAADAAIEEAMAAETAVAADTARVRLSVDSCIQLALRNNVAGKNAKLGVEMARQDKGQALSMYFPQISAAAGAFHADKPFIEYGIEDIGNAGIRNTLEVIYAQYGMALGLPNSLTFVEKGVVAGVTAMQPIYAGGRIVTGNRLAKVGVEAAELQQQIAERDMVQQCEELYWQVVALEEKKQTVDEALELLESLQKDVTGAVDAGLVLKNDLLRVNLELNKMRSNKIQLDNGIALSRSALCQYIGYEGADSLVVLTDTLGEVENPAIYRLEADAAAQQRQEADLLDISVRAEELKRRMTLGEALPQVVLGASYSYNDIMGRGRTNLVGVAMVQVPITDWWATGHKLKKHSLEIEKARNTRDDLMQKLELQTRQIYDELYASYLQAENAREAIASAEENLRQSRVNYSAGLISLSELLEAQTLYRQALNQYDDERISYSIKLTHYKLLTGNAEVYK